MEMFLRILLLIILIFLGYFAQSSTVMYAAASLVTILCVDLVFKNFNINQWALLAINIASILLIIGLVAYLLNLVTVNEVKIFGQSYTKGHGFLKYEGDVLVFLKKNAVTTGILFLMIYALIPVAQGEITFVHVGKAFITWKAWVAIAVGIGITLLAKNGVPLMEQSPDVLAFLVIGIIVGVVAFNGYPTGPLIGSGLAYFAFIFIESSIRVFHK